MEIIVTVTHKEPKQNVRRREIYASDDEWKKMAAGATAADKSISRYLLDPANLTAPPDSLQIRTLEVMQDIRDRMDRIVLGLEKAEPLSCIAAVRELVAIDRRLAALMAPGSVP